MCSSIVASANLLFLPVESPSLLLTTSVVMDVLEGLGCLDVSKFSAFFVSVELNNKLGNFISTLLFGSDLRVNDLFGVFGKPCLLCLSCSLFCHAFTQLIVYYK